MTSGQFHGSLPMKFNDASAIRGGWRRFFEVERSARDLRCATARRGTDTPLPTLLRKEDNDLRARTILAGGHASRRTPGRRPY
jgi:hypothetical protein